ncbi:IPTL-CTERM sorting domain-containing protein [Parahaliea mediterranea]|uniref:IPTL-CTERM sorting domain-containing protein n=1 Tax=Parahaliea mediterranea TaxID=651086 RepID=A0A939IKK7_9GAMM|nr:IPTL-CTERM sorting domain-containing protein [Parahaliea mediterranea]MBN7795033.1 IPTL-CTERM sorting domain-containing protein [Parahaliea mediterranea]
MRPRLTGIAAFLLYGLSASESFAAVVGQAEFRVNDSPSGLQVNFPGTKGALRMTPGGHWVIGWSDNARPYARVYDADGQALGGILDGGINLGTFGVGAAIDASDNVVLTFSRTAGRGGDLNGGTGEGTMLRRFDSNGVPLGPAIDIPDNTTGHQYMATADFAGGDIIVAFGGESIAGGAGQDMGRKRYRFQDGLPLTAATPVNSNGFSNRTQLSLDVNPAGQAAYAWLDDTTLTVRFRSYDAGGNPVAGEAIVSTATTQTRLDAAPGLAINSVGESIVTWSGFGSGSDKYDIYMRRYDASGNPIDGAPVRVNVTTAGDQSLPAVAVNTAGNFVIAWATPEEGDGFYEPEEVRMRLFDASGTPKSGDIPVNQTVSGKQSNPVVGIDDSGRIAVAWSGRGPGDDDGIFARVFKPDTDSDGIADDVDACPAIPGDASANGCPDADGDGVRDADDAFPNDPGEHTDSDADGIGDNGDACPAIPGDASANGCPDADGDGVRDADDAFPNDPGEHTDSDADGIGDNGDACPAIPGDASANGCPDADGDGVRDADDAFPNDPGEHTDSDADGIGDNGDACPAVPGDASANGCPDADGDGVRDTDDAFPNDPGEHTDSDADGIGDNGDACPAVPGDASANGCPDADGDGVRDTDDAFPNDPGEHTDSDGDGAGDNGDPYPHAITRATAGAATLDTSPADSASTCSVSSFGLAPLGTAPPLPGDGLSRMAAFVLTNCHGGGTPETVQIRIDFGEALPADGVLYKLLDSRWVAITGASISGSVATYTLADNGPYDLDPTAGVIRDPVTVALPPAQAPAAATPVPTLPTWALALLAALSGGLGFRRLRARATSSNHQN